MGIGAKITGCAAGPFVIGRAFKRLRQPPHFTEIIRAGPKVHESDTLFRIEKFCERLALRISNSILDHRHFVVIGGDHSCAMGTWSGAAKAVRNKGGLGLIWIDAHMDCHTPESSPSGAIHGMPLAALLGFGPKCLTNIGFDACKIMPENLCLIGVRSFESMEADLLRDLGVRVYLMEEIHNRGLSSVFQEAMAIVERNSVAFGISIDLDAITPEQAPGVGTPVEGGLKHKALCQCLTLVAGKSKFLGLEIAEFNPRLDKNSMTANVILDLLEAGFPKFNEPRNHP